MISLILFHRVHPSKKAADRKWSVEIISVANKLNKIKTGEFDFGAESCGEEIQIRSSSWSHQISRKEKKTNNFSCYKFRILLLFFSGILHIKPFPICLFNKSKYLHFTWFILVMLVVVGCCRRSDKPSARYHNNNIIKSAILTINDSSMSHAPGVSNYNWRNIFLNLKFLIYKDVILMIHFMFYYLPSRN